MKFDINKKGYDTEQVDNFINKLSVKYEEKLSEQKDRVFSLKNELALMEERLETYKDKDKQISQALIYAVEKAEQIESNASKLYDLEIKRIRLIYKQWEEMMFKVGMLDVPNSLKKEIDSFSKTVKEVLDQNSRIGGGVIRKDLHSNSDNYIRNLLNKMDYAINSDKKTTPSSKSVISSLSHETEKENARMIDLSKKLDRITVKGSGNMADNYLNSDEEEGNSIFAKNITRRKAPLPNNAAFDLDSVLNPKEDLDEIMKAFDFFLETHPDD